MSIADARDGVPAPYRIALLAVLLVSFAYAVFVLGQVLVWVWAVLAATSVGVSLFAVYLFYRLVLAIERIADEL
ncbi:hypothetical protein ACNS7O_01545 [Haloferacaceae archaeon DSL9]